MSRRLASETIKYRLVDENLYLYRIFADGLEKKIHDEVVALLRQHSLTDNNLLDLPYFTDGILGHFEPTARYVDASGQVSISIIDDEETLVWYRLGLKIRAVFLKYVPESTTIATFKVLLDDLLQIVIEDEYGEY